MELVAALAMMLKPYQFISWTMLVYPLDLCFRAVLDGGCGQAVMTIKILVSVKAISMQVKPFGNINDR